MKWAATSPLPDGKGGLYLSNNKVASEPAKDEASNTGVAPGVINPVMPDASGAGVKNCQEPVLTDISPTE